MKQYKVVDLSYSQDPRQHLKEVRAYHELDGWHLLSVVYAAGRWLYYLEREAEPAPCGVVATPVGGEQSLPAPVRRVGGGTSGEVVTAGADVTAEGVSVETFRRPEASLRPSEAGAEARQGVRLPAGYRAAAWRNTTAVDEAGRVGLGLDLEGGEVVRLSLDLGSAHSVVVTLSEALSAQDAGSGAAGARALEHLARRIEGHLWQPRRHGSFPGEEN